MRFDWLRPIPQRPDYWATSSGAILSTKKGRLRRLSGHIHGGGYRYVMLSFGGGKAKQAVHRLVASAFLGLPKEGQLCRHLNGDQLDNRAENLAWGSHVDNALDRVLHGTDARGENNPAAKLNSKKVRTVRRLLSEKKSPAEIADEFGVSSSCIQGIASGRTWRFEP